MLYCSFCGKNQNEIRKLIAGPGSHICNECTDLCYEIAHQAPGEKLRLSPLPNAPGSFGCQEALHLAQVFGEMVDRHLAHHRAVFRNPEWLSSPPRPSRRFMTFIRRSATSTSKRSRPRKSAGSSSGSENPPRTRKANEN